MLIIVKCNGQINPKGMDFQRLRFSVETENIPEIRGVEYEFFRTEEEVKTGKFFKSEKSENGYISIGFDGFSCGERIFYRACVTTEEEKIYSETYSVEAGLNTESLVGEWIDNPRFDGRVSEFLTTFDIREEVVSARLYIVGLGFYSSSVNSAPTDPYYFKPLLTDFDIRRNLSNNKWYDEENFAEGKKKVCYDTYDVSALVKQGANELRVLLGTGWYCNTDKDFVDPSFTFGTPKLFFELHIQGQTSKTVIKSDGTCQVRNTAKKSQLFAGDFEDFTKDPEAFISATPCTPPSGELVPALAEKDVVIETLDPIEVKKTGNKLLYDFGKNHTGGLKLQVKGKRGDDLTVKYYEVLDQDGKPNPHTSRWIAYENGETPVGYIDQQGEYVLSGEVDEIAPLFHWNCYRYAEIELPKDAEILSIQSLFISTDVEENGQFRCSSKILNDLYRAFVLTQKDNMHCGVPSDCPHREKLPYTGDGQLVAESAMYVFGAEEFYRKWLQDIIAAQGKNGWVPYTAPFIAGGGGYWWCNALTSVPLTLYKFTGDKSVLREALQPALKLVGFYNSMHEGDYIIRKTCTVWLLGDWLAPDEIASNTAYVNTLAFYSAVSQIKEACDILGERKISEDMEALRGYIKQAINAKFFDTEKFCYGNGVQGEDILPLINGIAEPEISEKLWEKVVAHYRETGHIDTGIVLTPVLLQALVEHGDSDVAIKLMQQREYPSYAWMLENETTLCEHWSKYWPKTCSVEGEESTALDGDVSHCHPMYGSVVAWLYKHVAGLDLSRLCEKKILFAPKFTDAIYGAYASKQTKYGKASIEYDACGSMKLRINVPFGVEGEVRLPRSVCETFYVYGSKQLKSRKRGEYSYVKLTGGEWLISSDITFG